MSQEKLQTDGLRLTRDEALELTIHHLRLAGLFFELAPEGRDEEESLKICLSELARQVPIDDLQRPAMMAFLQVIVKRYEEAKEND